MSHNLPNTDVAAHSSAQALTQPLIFVIEALTVGGAEQMLIAMANQFAERGYPVHVVCLTQWGELADGLDERIERHLLEKKPGLDASLPGKLRRLIKSIQPAAVNSHLFTANLWTRLALLFSDVRVVVTEHSRDEWKGRLYRTIDKVLVHACHRLVAVSNDTANFYTDGIGLPVKKVMVINNGIETELYAHGCGESLREQWLSDYVPEADRPNCVFVGIVGRLVEAKNHGRLLEAAALWKESAPHIRTLIVGDGELADSIDEEILNRELSDRVFRLGSRRDIPNVLAALDIFVLCSDREGHPLTALEAQASGTAVVLTRAGGSEDAVANDGQQTGGFLVEKHAVEFADAVAKLASDSTERNKMAEFAQGYALKHFDLEKMVDRYSEVLLG